jgi:predicted HTH transcriptional regulator
VGLENDYKVLHKPSKDGFEQHLRNICESNIGKELGQLIDIRFLARGGKEICVVTVQPSPRPVWIREKGEEEFYLRIGNRNPPLGKRELAEYIRMR